MNRGYIAEMLTEMAYFDDLSQVPEVVGQMIANLDVGKDANVYISEVADDEGNAGNIVDRISIVGVRKV